MKKSLRVLSLILSVVMIMSCATILGNAYVAYKGNSAAVKNTLSFDDTNFASFSTDQYASMALDEIDRMLASADMNVNIFIGTLDLRSIDRLIASIESVWAKATGIKSLLGDAEFLNLDAITGKRRTNTSDLEILYAVLDLLGDQAGIAQKYVNGSIDLGMLQSVVSDYVFNIRSLVFGLLSGLTGIGGVDDDYDYFDDQLVPPDYANPSNPKLVRDGATLDFIQDVINDLILGEWKQLDDLFYSSSNKGSHVVYSEYMFHNNTASGALVTDAEPNTAQYDYYGWVHPDEWVTFGLGGAIRVANGAAAPAPDYSCVDVSAAKSIYSLVEELLLQAYNGIAVPVLNRITARWLREKCGYTFDEKYTERYLKDANGNVIEEEINGEKQPKPNPDYDYLYMGEAPEGGIDTSDAIFKIFNPENINIPYATVEAPYNTFINALNHNAIAFVDSIISATKTVSGNNHNYTWTDPDDASISYSFTLVDGNNQGNLMNNILAVLKFVLKATGEEFFSKDIINRGEFKTPDEIDDMGYQEVLAYIIRSVINANVDWMYIPENAETMTIAGACMEAVKQLAYQDIPQFTYTSPAYGQGTNLATYNTNVVNKALAILMDVAAFNLNANLDAEYATASNSNYAPIATGSSITGLLPYLQDSGAYGTTAKAIAAWAVSTYASTQVPGQSGYKCLLNIDFNSDNYGGAYTSLTEDQVWADIDALLDALIPILGTDAWINTNISTNSLVSKSLIFDYIVYPILNGDWDNIYEIFQRNNSSDLNNSAFNLEKALIQVVKNVFDLLFPNLFPADISNMHIDDILQNDLLGKAAYDLLMTLSANRSSAGAVNTAKTIQGRGKIIAGVALPIVCQILGLSSDQEFGELENYAPAVIVPNDQSAGVFKIYNGSSGVNTSYRTADGNYTRMIDNLYSYTVTSATCKVINGGSGTHNVSLSSNTLAGGESADVTIAGLNDGETLEITINYNVYDETGASLGSTLTNTNYCYVTTEDKAKGDDASDAVKVTVGGNEVTYAPNVYLSAGDGLSDLDDYTVTIKSGADGNNASTANVNGVVWLGADTSRNSVTGMSKDGTYILHPFRASDAYTRTEFEYEKDENDAYVLDDWDMRIKTGAKVIEGKTNVSDGVYIASYTLSTNGGSQTFQVYIHLYDDYGLGSLTRNEVKANRRAADTVNSDGADAFEAYQAAVVEAAKFVYPPQTHGFYPGVRNNSFENYIASDDAANKYLELYRTLYAARKALEDYPPESGSGAQAIYNAVEAIQPHNYERKSFTYNGTTLWYKDYLEYNDADYSYMGMRNYVAHTYKSLKNFINDANALVDRDYKYIAYTEEEFNELTAEEKAKVVEDYNKLEPDVITALESAYILHMLSLKSSRLIELKYPAAQMCSKLQLMYNLYGTKAIGNYLPETYEPYSDAAKFAKKVLDDESQNAEQINKAISMLVETYKQLAEGADYTALDALMDEIKNDVFAVIGFGYDFDNDVVVLDDAYNQQFFTVESYAALLEAYAAAKELTDAHDLTKGDQSRIDEAQAALAAAYEGLVDASGGGGDEGDFTWETDEGYEIEGPNGEYYAPFLDDGVFQDNISDVVETDDYGTLSVDGVLYGVTPDYADEETLAEILQVEGGYVEIIPYSDAANSAGSLILIMNEETEEPEACVILAYRGDLNSDADYTAMDMLALDGAIKGRDGYIYDDASCRESLLFPSADLTGDGSYDFLDINFTKNVIAGTWMINQVEGGRYYES